MVLAIPFPTNVILANDTEYSENYLQVISDARPEIVANYVVWRAVMSALPYLHREARMALEEFEQATGKMRFVHEILEPTLNMSTKLFYQSGKH